MVVITGAATTACAVDVDAPDVSARTAAKCERLVGDLPTRVSDQPGRAVRAPQQTAAWGDDPAIAVRCGVGTPEGFSPTATCLEVDGIGWYAPQEQLDAASGDLTLTTIGRSPRVEVRVPRAYLPPATVLADLADAVQQGTRRTGSCQ